MVNTSKRQGDPEDATIITRHEGKQGWFIYIIQSINCLSPNVWAFVFVMIGMVLLLKNKDVVGASLVTGGFAIFQARLSGGRATDITSGSIKEVRNEIEVKAVKQDT